MVGNCNGQLKLISDDLLLHCELWYLSFTVPLTAKNITSRNICNLYYFRIFVQFLVHVNNSSNDLNICKCALLALTSDFKMQELLLNLVERPAGVDWSNTMLQELCCSLMTAV